MKDFRGAVLECGDEVAYIEPYYRDMRLGTVLYVTKCGATIMPCHNDCEVSRESRMIVKIESEDDE